MNKVILMGRLTRDPEIRTGAAEGAGSFARYTLAVDRRGRREDGGQTADFINCVAFGRSAEFAEKYLRQGTKIAITGRIQTGSYTNRDGQKVYTTDVVVEEQEFAESKNAGGENSGYGNGNGGNGSGANGGNGYQRSNSRDYGQRNGGSYQQRNNGGQRQQPEVDVNGFMNIPDGIDEDLPFA